VAEILQENYEESKEKKEMPVVNLNSP